MRLLPPIATLVVVCAALVAAATSATAPSAGPLTPAFVWLVPTPPPASWHQAALPSGAAVLSYPAFLHRERSDAGSFTVVEKNAQGLDPIYLNATPRQGNEQLQTWPAYRMAILREESAKTAHEHSRVVDVAFRGGYGSCVLDDYVTRIKSRHYEEIACYVEGAHGGSVVVAATLASLWPKERRLLEQVVAAYRAA
jgi:hypothetical protein